MEEQADEEEARGRKRPANVMKGADTTFLYAESKAARYAKIISIMHLYLMKQRLDGSHCQSFFLNVRSKLFEVEQALS